MSTVSPISPIIYIITSFAPQVLGEEQPAGPGVRLVSREPREGQPNQLRRQRARRGNLNVLIDVACDAALALYEVYIRGRKRREEKREKCLFDRHNRGREKRTDRVDDDIMYLHRCILINMVLSPHVP